MAINYSNKATKIWPLLSNGIVTSAHYFTSVKCSPQPQYVKKVTRTSIRKYRRYFERH